MDVSSSAFPLTIFGTDNCVSYKDVIARWKYLEREALKFGIKILGFSPDGDPRFLSAMKNLSFLSESTSRLESGFESIEAVNTWPWLHPSFRSIDFEKFSTSYAQDMVHIGTKLRNRLLKKKLIPVCDYIVSVDHLHTLIETLDKSVVGITSSDLNPEDRVNFKSVEKIISVEVRECLSKIPESKEKDMSLEKRIYNIWYAVFFLRIWRFWIRNSTRYTVKDNFITNNSYECIEINAHHLALHDLGIAYSFYSEAAGKTVHITGKLENFDCEEDVVDESVQNIEEDEEIVNINHLLISLENDEQANTKRKGTKLKNYPEVTNLKEDSPFVRIKLEDDSEIVVKKSSYCWLLQDDRGRVSSDRLKRFHLTAKKKKLPTANTKRKSNNVLQINNDDVDNSSSSSDDNIEYDSVNTEESGNSEVEQTDKTNRNVEPEVLMLENYYAVFYDEGWFIGRAIEKLSADTYKFTFLKQDLDNFVWPKIPDQAIVS
ncbi:hypothetical protein FQR65_LT12598 [Abscondita terminalis]|nr:hypothetical protein FQR65_LT12598 [Abscondita terminalis]